METITGIDASQTPHTCRPLLDCELLSSPPWPEAIFSLFFFFCFLREKSAFLTLGRGEFWREPPLPMHWLNITWQLLSFGATPRKPRSYLYGEARCDHPTPVQYSTRSRGATKNEITRTADTPPDEASWPRSNCFPAPGAVPSSYCAYHGPSFAFHKRTNVLSFTEKSLSQSSCCEVCFSFFAFARRRSFLLLLRVLVVLVAACCSCWWRWRWRCRRR